MPAERAPSEREAGCGATVLRQGDGMGPREWGQQACRRGQPAESRSRGAAGLVQWQRARLVKRRRSGSPSIQTRCQSGQTKRSPRSCRTEKTWCARQQRSMQPHAVEGSSEQGRRSVGAEDPALQPGNEADREGQSLAVFSRRGKCEEGGAHRNVQDSGKRRQPSDAGHP